MLVNDPRSKELIAGPMLIEHFLFLLMSIINPYNLTQFSLNTMYIGYLVGLLHTINVENPKMWYTYTGINHLNTP